MPSACCCASLQSRRQDQTLWCARETRPRASRFCAAPASASASGGYPLLEDCWSYAAGARSDFLSPARASTPFLGALPPCVFAGTPSPFFMRGGLQRWTPPRHAPPVLATVEVSRGAMQVARQACFSGALSRRAVDTHEAKHRPPKFRDQSSRWTHSLKFHHVFDDL